ncbi:MAG TPA: carboxypeptidase-like regulatory domain-containing protein [Thermoanaerobaculia bacterium]|nr:carboxypeptidase-like regulatory domain-containing protein [Thermoanaerobaculia bacterium]
MRKIAIIAAAAITFSGASGARAEVRLSDVIEVLGNVSEAAGPVDEALVIAFNLSNSYIIQTFSQKNGRFELPPLPSGVYRIIAVKQGFAPAVATVTPSRQRGRELSLRLRAPEALTRADKDAIWEARRAIPSDILRELNIVDESLDLAAAPPTSSRFSGEMVSMTGFGEAGTTAAFAQTALGVQGRFGEGWTVNVSGAIRTVDDETYVFPTMAESVAEASGVTMEIQSGSESAYRIATLQRGWLMEAETEGLSRSADFRSHNFEWRRDGGNVRVRYLAHENLFESAPLGSELFELAAEGYVVRGNRSELEVTLRVGQESMVGTAVPLRTADLATRGSYELIPSLSVSYGVNSRLTEDGHELAPETGLIYHITPATSLTVHGAMKVDDRERHSPYPSLMFLDQPWRLAPRYEYAIALSSGTRENARLTARASVAEVDSVLRIVFDERFEEFWDAFYLEPGDVYRAFSVDVRRQLGESVAFDLATRAGYVSNELRNSERDRHYLSGSVQSLYIPWGTAVNVAWRFIEQPAVDSLLAVHESERINLRLAQGLGRPLGLRLLVGLDLARALNSPVLADGEEGEGYQKRLVGGVSFAF